MNFLSLFSGIGGLDLGLERAGMKCVAQVEIDPFCRKVLAKNWPNVPRFEDVRTINLDSVSRLETIHLIAGGFPCQDLSVAGNGAGLSGERSGLWYEYLRIIREIRPKFVLVENVAALLNRGFGTVLGGLAALGYDAEWSTISACAMGAPHTRDRLFIVANLHQIGRGRSRHRHERRNGVCSGRSAWEAAPRGQWRDVERWAREIMDTGNGIATPAERCGMVDGVPNRLERITGCGNAVLPQIGEWIGRRIMEAANS